MERGHRRSFEREILKVSLMELVLVAGPLLERSACTFAAYRTNSTQNTPEFCSFGKGVCHMNSPYLWASRKQRQIVEKIHFLFRVMGQFKSSHSVHGHIKGIFVMLANI